jgi:hypothetical protein
MFNSKSKVASQNPNLVFPTALCWTCCNGRSLATVRSITAPNNAFWRATQGHRPILWQLGEFFYQDGERGEAFLKACCLRVQEESSHFQPLFQFLTLCLLGLDRQDSTNAVEFCNHPSLLQLVLVSACFGVVFELITASPVVAMLLGSVSDRTVRRMPTRSGLAMFQLNTLGSVYLMRSCFDSHASSCRIRIFVSSASSMHILIDSAQVFDQSALNGPAFSTGGGNRVPFAIQSMRLSCAPADIPSIPSFPSIGTHLGHIIRMPTAAESAGQLRSRRVTRVDESDSDESDLSFISPSEGDSDASDASDASFRNPSEDNWQGDPDDSDDRVAFSGTVFSELLSTLYQEKYLHCFPYNDLTL